MGMSPTRAAAGSGLAEPSAPANAAALMLATVAPLTRAAASVRPRAIRRTPPQVRVTPPLAWPAAAPRRWGLPERLRAAPAASPREAACVRVEARGSRERVDRRARSRPAEELAASSVAADALGWGTLT